MQVALKVNGKSESLELAPNTLLVQALREHLKLTGTHVGCDTAQCGACTVILNGNAVKSCNVLAVQVAGTSDALKKVGRGVPPASKKLRKLRRNCTGNSKPRVPR